MVDSAERARSAEGIYQAGLENVRTEAAPTGQKYAPGSRVWIQKDLGPAMSHFRGGCWATVAYTYGHAYGGGNVDSYSLVLDGIGSVAWYYESQLHLTSEGDD